MKPSKSAIAFAIVILFCAAQVAWWVVFQFRESDRFERAAAAVAGGDTAAARSVLGVREDGELDDRFHRQRLMFMLEGAFLGVAALVAVIFFYTSLRRERRLMAERERFLAGATHEFKTPLATIKLGLESLEAGRVPDDRRADYTTSMVNEVDRLERGLSNLLAAAVLRGNGARQDFAEGDLRDDVERVVGEFRPRYEAAGVELEVDSVDAVPIARDEAAIRVVIHNLLDNGLRYSERGGKVQVELSCDERRAYLRVSDVGRGIARADLRRVFDPFFRGAGTRDRGGTGLGLHLVREFVRMHGGTVEVHSEGPDRGSTFRLALPLRQQEAA